MHERAESLSTATLTLYRIEETSPLICKAIRYLTQLFSASRGGLFLNPFLSIFAENMRKPRGCSLFTIPLVIFLIFLRTVIYYSYHSRSQCFLSVSYIWKIA